MAGTDSVRINLTLPGPLVEALRAEADQLGLKLPELIRFVLVARQDARERRNPPQEV